MNTIAEITKNTREIYMSSALLNQLLDYERVLDNLNLYAYDNWLHGELVEGPVVEKYWVTCKFMWPMKKMPDPAGAEKLLNYGCHITFQKSKIKSPVKVKSPEDFQQGTKYPKIRELPIWIVEISMPKKLMTDIERGSIDVEGENVDLADLEKAYENELDEVQYQNDEVAAGAEPAATPAASPAAAPEQGAPNVPPA